MWPQLTSISSTAAVLRKRVGLAVKKVVHHDDIVLVVVVWTWGGVACSDSHSSDPSIIEFDSEERQISVPRCGGNITAEQQLTVDAEKLHQRARPAVAVFLAGSTSIRLIHVGENR